MQRKPGPRHANSVRFYMKTSAAAESSISRQIESNRAVPRDVRRTEIFYRFDLICSSRKKGGM
jgi:hypothetical protein